MAGPIICCQDMQLPISKHANARELYDFEVWARTVPQKHPSASEPIKSLPRGVFGAERYFQVTVRPGLAIVPSTRTFVPSLDNHKPYQEVLSVAYIERNYKQVASFTSSRCHHNKYIEISLYEKQVTPPNGKCLTPKRRAKPLPSADTEDRSIRPPSPTWEEKSRPSVFGAEKNDDDLWLLKPSALRPCGKEPRLPSIIAEKKNEHQWPLKAPASRSPVKETGPPSIFVQEKDEHRGRWIAPTSPTCGKEAAPSSTVVERGDEDQWCFKRPTSPFWDMKAILSSTIAEKKDDDKRRLKPPASHPRGKKTSSPSVITEKEDAGQARSEISTVIPPGIIETAIKQLKLSEAQAKHSSVLADAAMAGAVVAGAASVGDTGVEIAAEGTAGLDDIFYMPPEHPLRPTEPETEDFCYLDEKSFDCYYPGRVSHTYNDYNDDGWEKVTACKECGGCGNYPW